ncbi:MAG TPA: hypothetical protein VIZ32_12185 [Vicinamibacterales bacterium]
MSTPHDNGDDDDVIAEWILEHPEVWADASAPLPSAFVDGVVADIVSGARTARLQRRETRRRRKLVATGVLSTLIVAGGAVGVAALVRSGQPTQPTAGVACRDGAGVDADVIVIEPTDDPVGGCGALWAAGRFDGASVAVGAAPSLVACISDAGVIEVYPGEVGTCSGLGLADAELVLDDENQLIVSLQDRVVDEINAQPCASARVVESIAQRLVTESELAGWRVEIRPDSVSAPCAKAAIDATTQVVQVVKFP